MFGWAFLNQAHTLDSSLVTQVAAPNLIEQASIDLENDLQVAWQKSLKPLYRPFLQRFGQQGVVRIPESPLCEVPSLVPFQMCVVEQNPHQLGHRHRRMCIVELDSGLFRKRSPVSVAAPEAPHEIGQRAGHEKIFLHES